MQTKMRLGVLSCRSRLISTQSAGWHFVRNMIGGLCGAWEDKFSVGVSISGVRAGLGTTSSLLWGHGGPNLVHAYEMLENEI
jgi:hypothetical protein